VIIKRKWWGIKKEQKEGEQLMVDGTVKKLAMDW
jgi:hypothetical protein